MKKNSLFFIFILFLFSCSENEVKKNEVTLKKEVETKVEPSAPIVKEPLNPALLKAGDIVFQTLNDSHSNLIALATQSPFTHCGIIIQEKDIFYVLEAFGEVRKTSLDNWIKQGMDEKLVVMRMKNYDQYFHKGTTKKAIEAIKSQLKKPYDSKYLWSDSEMYCSELVWKLFKSTLNIELCSPKKLSEYELYMPEIQEELEKMYGSNIPMNELMVSPGDLAASDFLEMLYSNY